MKDQFQSGGGNPNQPNEMSCADFDQLLADAIDGALSAAQMETFQSHAAGCADCGPLFTMASRGMKFLTALPEVEPPKNLVHNILAATTMVEESKAAAEEERKIGWRGKLAGLMSPNLMPAMRNLMQPRLAMTAAAAFFSISMLMNVSGIRMSDLSPSNLTPAALSNTASIRYHETTSKVVKYYENLRVVYEMETKIAEIKKLVSEEPAKPQGEQKKPQPRQDNTSDKNDSDDKDKNDKRNENAAEFPENVLAVVHKVSYQNLRPVSFEG
jgi:hypothetical protein